MSSTRISLMILSQCIFCQHLDATANTCSAFPSGIPEKILLNEISHQKPYSGDHGITFKAADNVTSDELKTLKFGKISEKVVA